MLQEHTCEIRSRVFEAHFVRIQVVPGLNLSHKIGFPDLRLS